MVKTDSKTQSKPVSEKELEEESDIEEIIEKDGLNSVNVTPDDTNYDSETYVGKPADKEEESTGEEPKKDKDGKSYIEQRKSYNMSNVDKNKLMHTRIGDHINYFDNGRQDNGIVTKMDSTFITIVKENGHVSQVHINDTFFVQDILVNKTWNDMDMEERTVQLQEIHAYSPRYLSKTWEQLPRELKDVMKISPTRNTSQSPTRNQEPLGGSDDNGHVIKVSRNNGAYKQNQALGQSIQGNVEKEGDAGTATIGTEGMNNPVYNTKKPHEPLGKTIDYKTKGVPEDVGNSWGIKYINKKEDKE